MRSNTSPDIILVETQIPENLGATARAMLNFNLKKLRIVSPLFDLSNEKILPLSAGADDVIKTIKKFDTFEESVKEFNILVATTNRLRSIKKKKINFHKLNKLIKKKSNRVGIVFGPEKSGLNNNHLSMCDYILRIDTNPKFSSLNLSHAVSLVAYEMMKGNLETSIKSNYKSEVIPAPKKDLMNFFKVLENELEKTNLFVVKERRKIITQKIRNIFGKIGLTSKDLATLIGVIKSLKKNKQK